MIDQIEKNSCVLCGACLQRCPNNCISFEEEYYSFSYPTIDKTRCTQCNLCERVCPVLHIPKSNSLKRCYAARSKCEKILKHSSSGGIFYELASEIIQQGGAVAGAAFDKNFKVRHEIVFEQDDILRLCGSKYVQSDISGVFPQIKRLLNEGKKILFVGSSCQTAALVTYLGNKPSNLLLIDFICHGIVSDKVFQEYKNLLEKKYKSKIKSFEFRNKENSWLYSGLKVEFENGKVYSAPLFKDLYMQGYFHNLNLKEACYSCGYKNFKGNSDITIGDFWGVQDLYPDFFNELGNSIVVINSNDGLKFFNDVEKGLIYIPIKVEDIVKYNKGLFEPFSNDEGRKEYFKSAKKKGYIRPLLKYVKTPFYKRLLGKIKAFLDKIKVWRNKS